MNLIEEITNVILLTDEAEKESVIEKIGDLFEYGNLEKNEMIEGANLLLSHIVHEKNSSVRESMLHAVNNAIVYKDIAADLSLDALLPSSTLFEVEEISYILSFLGFSGNPKYLSIIKSYLNHQNVEIKEAAQEAIIEIEYRSSKKKK
ncbi:hypothetical protein [Bacillus changyiensis]|uniref:hypothetical protein n=1 Tax=Bacillus changyiensis TaxID=3004103 RepID=UPI0022E5B77D|nr:hypothetical protein [Bacillus changyiensis]MDA1478265.1 hypothetical protein [Bacillus changyiensis]